MLSFWQQDAFFSGTDVVIVGAGFAGLWCAYEMKTRQPGLHITVLEKEPFPGGASVRNAGFACFGSPGEMLADAATMGPEAMWETVAKKYRGIRKLRQVLGDAAIGYDPCGGYECFSNASTFEAVADQLSWLNAGMKNITGVADAFTIEADRLDRLGLRHFDHLMANRLEGGLHSAKALHALQQLVNRMGVNVWYGCEVTCWKSSNTRVELQVKATTSFSFFTRRLLLATNAYTAQLTANLPVQPARGQILLTEPIPELSLSGTFHFDAGFYYWRNLGNRILLGGARHTNFAAENTFSTDTSTDVQQALEYFLHHHIALPHRPIRIEHRWAGTMGFTATKTPLLQRLQPHVWAMVACNGMGVALTPIVAEEASACLLA